MSAIKNAERASAGLDFWVSHLPKDRGHTTIHRDANPRYVTVEYNDPSNEPDVDCEEYCSAVYGYESDNDDPESNEGDFNTCKEGCEDSKKAYGRTSLTFDEDTGRVTDGIVPFPCYKLSELDGEGFSGDKINKLNDALLKAGFEPKSDRKTGYGEDFVNWIHPHEFVAGAGENEGEFPAGCWVHVRSKAGSNSTVADLVETLEKEYD